MGNGTESSSALFEKAVQMQQNYDQSFQMAPDKTLSKSTARKVATKLTQGQDEIKGQVDKWRKEGKSDAEIRDLILSSPFMRSEGAKYYGTYMQDELGIDVPTTPEEKEVYAQQKVTKSAISSLQAMPTLFDFLAGRSGKQMPVMQGKQPAFSRLDTPSIIGGRGNSAGKYSLFEKVPASTEPVSYRRRI